MKTKTTINFDFEIEENKINGRYNEYMGHGTSLCVEGIEDRDDGCGNLSAQIPKRGEFIIFSIPSGNFKGCVRNVYNIPDTNNISVRVRGEWDGIYGGLMGGLSCYGRFSAVILSDELVHSSWGDMAYAEYQLIRILRGCNYAHRAYNTFKKIECEDIEEEYKEYKEDWSIFSKGDLND